MEPRPSFVYAILGRYHNEWTLNYVMFRNTSTDIVLKVNMQEYVVEVSYANYDNTITRPTSKCFIAHAMCKPICKT